MKNKIFKTLAIVSICMLCISSVFAENIIRFNEKNLEQLEISEDLEDTYIGLAGQIDLDSKVNAISILMGETLNINGQTEYLVGLASNIKINGTVEKESYAMGTNINVSSDATLGKNAHFLAQNVNIAGKLDKKLFVLGETIRIDNAEINGDVYLLGNTIKIGKDVKVNGTVTYYGNAETNFNSQSDLKVNFIEREVEEKETKNEDESLLATIIGALIVAIESVVAYIIIAVINEKILDRAKEEAKTFAVLPALGNFGLGLLFLMVVPVISIITLLFATKVSIIVTAMYTIIILLSNIFFAAYVAQTIDLSRKVIDDKNKIDEKDKKSKDGFSIIATLFILSILFALPYVGTTIELISLCIGISLIIKTIIPKEESK